MIITDKELSKIEGLAQKAEDGPWWQVADTGFITNPDETNIAECQYGATADYIAAVSPDVVLSMIREIRKSRSESKRRCKND